MAGGVAALPTELDSGIENAITDKARGDSAIAEPALAERPYDQARPHSKDGRDRSKSTAAPALKILNKVYEISSVDH